MFTSLQVGVSAELKLREEENKVYFAVFTKFLQFDWQLRLHGDTINGMRTYLEKHIGRKRNVAQKNTV